MTKLLRFQGATIAYSDRPIITGLDFDVTAGEVVAITGPNGAGKSTLAKAIMGLIPVHGTFEVLGVDLAGIHFKNRRKALTPGALGYVPQANTVTTALPATVREVVATGVLSSQRWYHRVSKSQRAAVHVAIEDVGLAEHADTPITQLSGGQQRRALIARALASAPQLLVMDEPTAGVDPNSQATLVRTLAALRAKGLSMIIITHEPAPLTSILTRTLHLDMGRITSDQVVGS